MEGLAPKHVAMEGDKIGLQLGSLQKEITGILVALDINEEVVDEAIAKGANLIIAHHAIIFRPLANLQVDTPMGKVYEKLIKNDIAVYISHTNLDITEGGMNDWMAEELGIEVSASLEDLHTDQLYKLVVFVPKEHHESVRSAMLGAGAGHIGNYSHCSFNIHGQGTFKPDEVANPFIGQAGKFEQVDEVRIETVVPFSLKNKVIAAMLKTHPYEEVAYDLYKMELKGRTLGLGRVGKLSYPVSLAAFVDRVKQNFEVPTVRVVGDLNREIKKAAVLGGSGGRYWAHALRHGADVLVTGDIDYHTAQDALMAGITLIDPGHNAEKLMKPRVATWLKQRLEKDKYSTPVFASSIHTEPFIFV